MNSDVTAPEAGVGTTEHRRFPRYRLSAPIAVHLADAPEYLGMTVEISEAGMSALVGTSLRVGDTVELHPVGGGTASAVVRRQMGKLYAFEFLQISAEQAAKIQEMSRMLPLYHSRTLDLWKQ